MKTDNRPLVARSGDHQGIQIGTYGAEYLEVLDLHNAGKFDVVGWGVVQTGSWGAQTHRAAAFLAEAGWQPNVVTWRPWLSAGFSHGSGDDNPNDSTHGTFFQILPTPRPYARFPFWNMQNNDDFWGTLKVQPVSKLSMRSELHWLRLANSSDLRSWAGTELRPETAGGVWEAGSANGAPSACTIAHKNAGANKNQCRSSDFFNSLISNWQGKELNAEILRQRLRVCLAARRREWPRQETPNTFSAPRASTAMDATTAESMPPLRAIRNLLEAALAPTQQ